jgi:TRAP-type C4-dicarboxylate transport system substrate-binding protein
MAVALAGCHSARVDKTGGSSAGNADRITLTLLTGDALFAPEYVAAVERLSHGSITIKTSVAGNRPGYEASTVDAVRKGKAQLGSVGARVWDTFGVSSFRGVVAPLLVDNLKLEGRVLESPLADRMLAGLAQAGVVGLAVLPGPLRRPLGLSRALVQASDYRGSTIAIRYGGVARATLQALGATARGYPVGHLPSVDGAELDLNTIAENGFDVRARALTTNVVLWPRPQTIFANRAAFGRLTRGQRDILRRAGRNALSAELAHVARDEATALHGVCSRGTAALVSASAEQLASLRDAVRPVYAELAHDPLTRTVIARVRQLKDSHGAGSPDTIRCTGRKPRAEAAALEGTWQTTVDYRTLVAAGVDPHTAEQQRGGGTLELSAGHWTGTEPRTGFVWRGRYSVDGNVLRLITTACPRFDGACAPNGMAQFAWSVYRGRLSLALLSGTPSYRGLLATLLSRASP